MSDAHEKISTSEREENPRMQNAGAGTRRLFAIIIYPTRVSFVHYPIIISLLLVVHCSAVSGHNIRTWARIAPLRAATSVIVAQMRYRRFRFAICCASPLRFLLGSENATRCHARLARARVCVCVCVCVLCVHTIDALDVISHRPRNSSEIVISTKFPEVGYALKQRASMQVTRGGRFSTSLCRYYLFH